MERKRVFKLTKEDDFIICNLYLSAEKDSVQLAEMFNVKPPSIRKVLLRNNITMRKRDQNGAKNHMFNRNRELHQSWKGGVIYRNGYKMIFDRSHPNNQNGYVYEHRKAIEEHLGRILEKWETVHHKDKNKLNNSLVNLELISKSEHQLLHANERERDEIGRFI